MISKSLPQIFHRLRWLAITTDVAMLSAGYFGAAFAVLGRLGFPDAISDVLLGYPLLVGLGIVAFAGRGVYRSFIRYTSIYTYLRIGQAIAIASAVAAWPFFLLNLSDDIPWRLIPVFAAFGLGTTSMVRAVFAVWQTRPRSGVGKRVLIYGAGQGGSLAARELLQRERDNYVLLGFIDDNADKVGREMLGVRIMGTGSDLPQIVSTSGVDEIVIAIPSAPGSVMRQILRNCRSIQRRVDGKPVPEITNVHSYSGRAEEEREGATPQEIAMSTLLRRAPRDLDADRLRAYYHGRRVLVTGAGGSIGSEIALTIAAAGPERLILVDMSEENLHRAFLRVSEATGSTVLRTALGDVSSPGVIDHLIKEERPDTVIHAAAYKHVRLVEENPCQAIMNNVGGAINVARAAAEAEVDTVINVSTDKAVRPSAVMGATKRLCEIYLQGMNDQHATKIITVRFGNVLGSSGSVVPIITDQILRGGPVTVTAAEATRYFMLLSEAAQLTLHAASIGKGGELFVLDMGEPVGIQELVELLIELHGYDVDADIKIQYTGLSEGEKMHEELSYDPPVTIDGIDSITLDPYRLDVDLDELTEKVGELLETSALRDRDKALSQLSRLITGPARQVDSGQIQDRIPRASSHLRT